MQAVADYINSGRRVPLPKLIDHVKVPLDVEPETDVHRFFQGSPEADSSGICTGQDALHQLAVFVQNDADG